MIYSDYKQVRNLHRVLFAEFYNCHRIYIQNYLIDKKYYINSSYKMAYLLEGSMLIEDGDSRVRLNRGDIYCIKPHNHHRTHASGDSQPIFVVLELDLKCLAKVHDFDPTRLYHGRINEEGRKKSIANSLRVLLKGRLTFGYSDLELMDQLAKLLDSLSWELKPLEPERNLRELEALVVDISQELVGRIESGQDLTLKTIARDKGISYSYLSKQFKEFIGQTYREYLLEKQMMVFIKFMTREPDDSIANLALKAGYRSLSSFNKDFKSFFNITPRQMLELYLDLIRSRKLAYRDEVVIDFLNQIDSMDRGQEAGDMVLDFTGIEEILSRNYDKGQISASYRRVLNKLRASKDKGLTIICSYSDYLYLLGGHEDFSDLDLKGAMKELINTCRDRKIGINFRIE